MSEPSIFERIGGEPAIMSAVTLFYEKVMADAELARFFSGMDMDAQIAKQVAFMTMVFDGPHEYTGRDLTTAHAGLIAQGLDDRHFDAVASCLDRALRDLSVDAGLIDEVLALVETTRDAVFGRASSQ